MDTNVCTDRIRQVIYTEDSKVITRTCLTGESYRTLIDSLDGKATVRKIRVKVFKLECTFDPFAYRGEH